MTKSNELLNAFGSDRIASRQVDELIGISSGLCADGVINQAEAEFLQKWLVANAGITTHPLLVELYERVTDILCDGMVDADERTDLFATLSTVAHRDFELGEVLKATSLPICDPPPILTGSETYCFTGTFSFGTRKQCEAAVIEKGGICGSLNQKTDVLVIGVYATDSWKHSSFGNKIIKAAEMRDNGVKISLVTEEHWSKYFKI